MQHRQHYLTLDALRGVAALAVMIYHQQHAALMGHGYLAVDFFFILSGFVIAKAYERKLLSTLSVGQFATIRIARLYPLLIVATLIAAAYMLMSSVRRGEDLHWLALLPAALLALPDPSGMLAPDPFPIVPVVWSLFFELFANFAYAATMRWLATRVIAGILAVSGALLIVAIASHGNGELGNTYATLLPGFARVFCSFFAGVLFYRLHASGRLRAPVISPLLLAAVLLGLLAAPHALPWVYDVVCIFLLFPLILVAAMNNEPTARWTATARVSADLSYPLYLFHLPLLLWLGFVLGYLRITGPMQMAVMLAAVPALAYAAHAFFDRPVQALLKTRIAATRPPVAPAGKGARAL